MDKLSVKVLRYISSRKSTTTKEVLEQFGNSANLSLTYLENQELIQTQKQPVGITATNTVFMQSLGIYSITAKGIDFLESKPGADFDKWLTRWIAITAFIFSVVALLQSFGLIYKAP